MWDYENPRTNVTDAIYLDNNATTQVDERVAELVLHTMRSDWGNPSSLHSFGDDAAALVAQARGRVAHLCGAASPDEILFTSGGTESINTAVHAALSKGRPSPEAFCLTSTTEHAAVQRSLERYGPHGATVTVDVDHDGHIDVDNLVHRITAECRLVTLHWANNETGAILTDEEIARIAERCRAVGTPFHLDAVQIPGKHPLALADLGVDLASLSAHKFHGPKGVGALFIRRDLFHEPFPALLVGGPQEQERRGGTHNVPGIAGMGLAADLARTHCEDPVARAAVRDRRDALENGLLAALPDSRAHVTGAARLDNTTSLHIPGIDGELLLASLASAGVAVSGGAACSAATRGPSPVLLAMGFEEQVASETIRFSLSRLTTDEEVGLALERVVRVAHELRGLEAL